MLTTSQEIAELAGALSKAQGAFPRVTKGKTADAVTYSYSYADLADILEAVRKPLSDNGLAIIQPPVVAGEDVVLVTRLLHASGQWIESTFPVDMFEKPQETGSALTYARRYAASALLGIAAEEDDDGKAAQGGTKRSAGSGGKRPDCPKCGNNKAVIEGRDEFGGGWVCFKKKAGCGENWHDAARPKPGGGQAQTTREPGSDDAQAPPSGTPGCNHCGSVNVKPDPQADGWLMCGDCHKGTRKA
jgi:hypothetical protein